MVIDFHTHVYPDKIAERTINTLMSSAPDVKIYTKGTLNALLESMENAGIDKSVILPVATRKGQFDTINKFALDINRNYKNLVSFGGIHPDDDNIEEKLKFLKENGFKVIIVTWQESLKNKLLALEFLNRYDIPYDDICFTKDKYLIQGDILIDDNPEFLDDPRDKSLKFCVEYPYNSHIRSALKVDSLEDAVDLLLTEI